MFELECTRAAGRRLRRQQHTWLTWLSKKLDDLFQDELSLCGVMGVPAASSILMLGVGCMGEDMAVAVTCGECGGWGEK